MARAAADAGALLVHYGTDFVFDGRSTRPYTEEDEPAPQSVYASSKLLGRVVRRRRAAPLRASASRACSAARTARSSVDRIADAIRAGRPCARLHRPHRDAELRRRRRRRHVAADVLVAPRSVSITASTPA
jgi:hypothetical protein